MTLQEWMKLKNMNDAEFAAEVKVLSRSQISRIRRRKSIPSPQTAKLLEETTGIPAASFVFAERAA